MIRFVSEYRVRKQHISEFEQAYSATGAFGSMFLRNGCGEYVLLRHPSDPQRYVVTHTWKDYSSFHDAQNRAAQDSYRFGQQSQGWVESVNDVDESQWAMSKKGWEVMSRS